MEESNNEAEFTTDNGSVFTVQGETKTKQYVVDIDKIKTLDDVILIIDAMNLHLLAKEDGTGQFGKVFHLLKEANANA